MQDMVWIIMNLIDNQNLLAKLNKINNYNNNLMNNKISDLKKKLEGKIHINNDGNH